MKINRDFTLSRIYREFVETLIVCGLEDVFTKKDARMDVFILWR